MYFRASQNGRKVVSSVFDIYYNNTKFMLKCPMLNIYPQTSNVFRHQVLGSDLGLCIDMALVFATIEDAVWITADMLLVAVWELTQSN